MESGAKTATSAAQPTSAAPTSPAVAVPWARPRAAVTVNANGFRPTTACSQPGSVSCGTKKLLTNDTGKTIAWQALSAVMAWSGAEAIPSATFPLETVA